MCTCMCKYIYTVLKKYVYNIYIIYIIWKVVYIEMLYVSNITFLLLRVVLHSYCFMSKKNLYLYIYMLLEKYDAI